MSGFLNLVCPSCDAVSRIPADNAEDSRCSRCGAEMFPGHSIDVLDPIRLQKHIVSNDVPVLVEFWAPWCGPCRVTAHEFEEAARRLGPSLRLARVDTDQAAELGARYGVEAIPTMILFHRGREVARHRGSIKAAGIARFAAEHMPAPAEAVPAE